MREFDSIESKLLHQIHKCDTLLRRDMFLNIVDMKKVRAGVSSVWNEIGFGGGQGRLLKVLSQHEGGISQKDLVEIMDIRPSSVGELTAKLEQQGLVERKESEQDKRVVIISLTEAGREKVKKMNGARDKAGVDMLSCLSAEEKDSLSDLLGKVIYHIKEDMKDARAADEGCEGDFRRRGRGRRPFGADRPGHCGPHADCCSEGGVITPCVIEDAE